MDFGRSQKAVDANCNVHGLVMQTENFKDEGARILGAFRGWVEEGASGASGWTMEADNHEGWRVSVDEGEGKQGWLLLRASLHDPLLVLNVESDVTGGKPCDALVTRGQGLSRLSCLSNRRSCRWILN